MIEPKDKRTNKAKQPKKVKMGLGDAIETITEKTGIKKIVEAITDDCGCDERKKTLNKIKLPWSANMVRCFTPEQLEQFKEYRTRRTLKSWQPNDIKLLVDLYAHVFALQYNVNDICPTCQGSGRILLKIDEQLEIVYNELDPKSTNNK